MFGGGISRFGCLERPRAGFSSTCIDFYRFLKIFIDFHGFGRHPKPESLIPCGGLWRPVAAVWTPLYIDFSILEASILLDDECKIDGSGAQAWRLLDDE